MDFFCGFSTLNEVKLDPTEFGRNLKTQIYFDLRMIQRKIKRSIRIFLEVTFKFENCLIIK